MVASSYFIVLLFCCDLYKFCRDFDGLLRQVLLRVFYDDVIGWCDLVAAVFDLSTPVSAILDIPHHAEIERKAEVKQPQANNRTSLRLAGILNLKRLQKMKDHDSNQCKDVTGRPDQMHLPEIDLIDEHKHKDKNRYDDDCYVKRCAKGRNSV